MIDINDFLLLYRGFVQTKWQLLCARREVHTHSVSRAQFLWLHYTHFALNTVQVRSHHIWLKQYVDEKVCVCCAHVITLHISFFSLMYHPSLFAPSLLFPHGQRVWSAVLDILSGVSRRKIDGQARSDIDDEEFGYLAKATHFTQPVRSEI